MQTGLFQTHLNKLPVLSALIMGLSLRNSNEHTQTHTSARRVEEGSCGHTALFALQCNIGSIFPPNYKARLFFFSLSLSLVFS